MKSAVFLERDGVLILPSPAVPDSDVANAGGNFIINEAAIEPLRQLKAAGFLLIVTTNQPGISRGFISRNELDLMHSALKRRFPVDAILVCPHDELDRCPCRKPRPGLLFEAAFHWHIDLERSFVVSNKWQDAAAAHNAGCISLLLKGPSNGSGHRDILLEDLPAIVRKILQLNRNASPAPAVAQNL